MTMAGLLIKGVRHGWFRNALLMLSIVIAYMLFGVLVAFERAYSSAAAISTSRIVTVNKINFMQPLSLAQFQAIQGVEGIRSTSYAAWFGGYYQEPRNRLHTIAVEPRSYLEVYGDDLSLTEEGRATFIREQDAVLVGESMAERFGWRVGDRIPIINPGITRADGAVSWSFRIADLVKGTTPFVDTS
ncbi:MAG: ABC transporter permease, partial [Pseudomonadota bacterium]